jgi:hypothetical protein
LETVRGNKGGTGADRKAPRFFRVKDWDTFQHYRDRARPTWIKLYASLLRDYGFQRLEKVTQLALILIWLLMSQQPERRLPYDARWIALQIGYTPNQVDLDAMLQAGFIEIEPPAEGSLEAPLEVPERSRNGASNDPVPRSYSSSDLDPDLRSPEEDHSPADDRGNSQHLLLSLSADQRSAGTPKGKGPQPEDLARLWNEAAPNLSPAQLPLGAEVRKHAAARLRARSIDVWQRIFTQADQSPFLRGESTDFHATFGWAMERKAFADKVLEGRYDARRAAKPSSVLEVAKQRHAATLAKQGAGQ